MATISVCDWCEKLLEGFCSNLKLMPWGKKGERCIYVELCRDCEDKAWEAIKRARRAAEDKVN